LGCGLSDLELLGHTLAGHVVRPPQRRRQTSLQASWWILDERDVGQSGRLNLDRSWNRS
jgi:hypothetical protein